MFQSSVIARAHNQQRQTSRQRSFHETRLQLEESNKEADREAFESMMLQVNQITYPQLKAHLSYFTVSQELSHRLLGLTGFVYQYLLRHPYDEDSLRLIEALSEFDEVQLPQTQQLAELLLFLGSEGAMVGLRICRNLLSNEKYKVVFLNQLLLQGVLQTLDNFLVLPPSNESDIILSEIWRSLLQDGKEMSMTQTEQLVNIAFRYAARCQYSLHLLLEMIPNLEEVMASKLDWLDHKQKQLTRNIQVRIISFLEENYAVAPAQIMDYYSALAAKGYQIPNSFSRVAVYALSSIEPQTVRGCLAYLHKWLYDQTVSSQDLSICLLRRLSKLASTKHASLVGQILNLLFRGQSPELHSLQARTVFFDAARRLLRSKETVAAGLSLLQNLIIFQGNLAMGSGEQCVIPFVEQIEASLQEMCLDPNSSQHDYNRTSAVLNLLQTLKYTQESDF